MLYKRFRQFIKKEDLLKPGDNLVIGISGGPDSVCLGHLLTRWRKEFGGEFLVGSLNHGLREAAAEETELVARLAEKWGLGFQAKNMDVKELADQDKRSLQDAARSARLTFFRELMARIDADRVALGHQADDQAETVLLWFLRGSGLKGLGGIRPAARMSWGTIIHPLLPFRREEISAYLKQHGLPFRHDESNFENKYLRNRLRLELIPRLEKDFNPRLQDRLVNLAQQIRAADSYLDSVAEELFDSLNLDRSGRELSVPVSILKRQPPVLSQRLWGLLIKQIKGNLKGISSDHYHFLASLLADNKSGNYLRLPGGLLVRREFDNIVIGDDDRVVQPEPRQLRPGETVNWGAYQFSLESVEQAGDTNSPERIYLNGDLLNLPLTIRSFREGDKIVGRSGEKKVKRYFNKYRVPLSQRSAQPVISSGGEVIYLPGVKLSEKYRSVTDASKILCFSWQKLVIFQ